MNEKTERELINLIRQAGISPGVPLACASDFLELLFEIFFESTTDSNQEIASLKKKLKNAERLLPKILAGPAKQQKDLAENFFSQLPETFKLLILDAQALLDGDPAARDLQEVVNTYPGFFAIYTHRLAHLLYQSEQYLAARMLSECSHRKTGIDIHPGAQIGESFCIDHGTGIVIGETSIIGKNVKLYQGVTLGGLSVAKNLAGSKRHPTIENGVVVYANATILGGKTIIGSNSIIGANVWLTASVPANSKVFHQPKISVKTKVKKGA